MVKRKVGSESGRATALDHQVLPESFRLDMVLLNGRVQSASSEDYHALKRLAGSVRRIGKLRSFKIVTEKGAEVCSYFGR